MATFPASTCIYLVMESEMTAILALEQLEDMYLEDLDEEIASVLRGEDTDASFAARVLIYNLDELCDEQLVLKFSHAELFRRFGKLSPEAQEQLGRRLLDWTEQQRDQVLTAGRVNPNLRMEVEFQWSATKRRRLAISYHSEDRIGGSREPYHDVFLTLTLL